VKQPSIALSSSSINDLVGKIRIIASQYNLLSLNRQIEVCESLLKENALIDVAILGQFKAGKSSFINSLAEKEILPVGVIPVTTVITRLQYGDVERAVVTYFDGTRNEVSIGSLEAYISEASNPANIKNVDIVDIELPALIEYAGLRLVDTPGMGSVFKYHMKTSVNWLPEVGAAILTISADRPLSQNDLELISELRHHTPNIVLLLTKADLLTTEQQSEVVNFFKQTLIQEFNREFPIFLYSTRSNTKLFKYRIEAGLLFGLSLNRDIEFQRIIHHKAQSLLESCLSYLEIAKKVSLEGDKERQNLSKLILDEKTSYDQINHEITVIARDNQHQTRTLLNNYLKQYKRPLTVKLRENLSAQMNSWKVNLWEMTKLYREWLNEAMSREIRFISKNQNGNFLGTLNKAHVSLTRQLEIFRMILDDNLEKVLGVKLAEPEWKIDMVEPDNPDIKVFYAFDIHIDQLWFLIPMFIFRGLFERHFLKQIPWTVEVNLSRLTAQWEERINKAIEGMLKQTLKYIREELSTIDALLSGAHSQTEEIQRLITDLQTYLDNPK
jgi:GTP-binding protein EngB required for normal cell division